MIFCLLLGGGLLVLAWRRPNRQRRALRLLASAVAAAALWLAAYPPLRPVPAARAEAILLTENYSPDTLRGLLRRLGRGTPVWRYGSASEAPGTRPLASLLSLAEQRPALRRVHVLGQGLPSADLPLLGQVAVISHAPALFVGFRAAYWDHRVPLGDVVRMEGAVQSPAGAPAWVCLRAAGAVRDSVKLPTGSGPFRLHYQPKTVGLARYELLLRQAARTLATEPVPVEITAPVLPAVLLLAATPSFEFKFLKNYLGEAHYAAALRTTVSRGLVQTEVVNQPARALDRLTPALLARFAVVVCDAASLASLTAAETQAVQGAVRAGKLGLVLLANNQILPKALPARADFVVLPRNGAAGPQRLAWLDAPGAALAPLPTQLRPSPALRVLVTGPNRVVAAAGRRVGLGAAVVSVVGETFRWSLQGQASTYASFWNRLLAAALPPAAPAAIWREGIAWPRVHQPLTLRLAAGTFPETPPTVTPLAGGPAVRLALRQDPRLPEWSTALFWADSPGWHQVRGPGRTAHHFYVFTAGAWSGTEAFKRQPMAENAQATASAVGKNEVLGPWPAGWFFGLFLLAAGFLWLEEKL